MAIAFVQKATNASAQPQLTGVAGSDFLTLSLFYILSGTGAATPTFTDSTTQLWNADNVPTPQGRSGDWVGVANFSLPNANAGTHTLTVSVTGSLVVGYAMAEWSGMPLTASLDQIGLTGGTTYTTQTMACTANATTAQASELAIVCMGIHTGSGASAAITDPPTGTGTWISLALDNTWQSSDFGYESAYQILSSTGRPSASWNWTGSTTDTYQSAMTTYGAASASKGGLMLSLMGVG
jgi:hypothetical protein